VELGGERQKLFVFCMRSRASGVSFHQTYPHYEQQTFWKHMSWRSITSGGVFVDLRYDSLKC
jgi:hypothetical protein